MQILTDIYCRVNDDIVLDMDCERVVSTVTCSFKYTNNGNDDYYLFKRDTPLEGVINSPYIYAYGNGEPLEYKGMIVLRDAPTRKDFVLLKAGKSISASISLTDAFEFTRNTIYTIQYNKPVEYIPRDEITMCEGVGALRATTVFKSDTVLILDFSSLSQPEAVDENLNLNDHNEVMGQSCDEAVVIGGNVKQENNTLEIHEELCDSLSEATTSVKNDKMYKKWFGKYSLQYSSRVRYIFKRSFQGLERKRIFYLINYKYCKENMIGITWWDSGFIALCNRYFQIQEMYCMQRSGLTKEGAIVNLLTQMFGRTRYITSDPKICQRFTWYPIFALHSSGNYEHFYCEAQQI